MWDLLRMPAFWLQQGQVKAADFRWLEGVAFPDLMVPVPIRDVNFLPEPFSAGGRPVFEPEVPLLSGLRTCLCIP